MNTEELTDLSDSKKGWEKLIESAEWSQLVSILQGQVDGMQNLILFSPLRGADEVYAQEYMKGQIEGRLSITNTVTTIISELTSELDSIRKRDNATDDA